MKAGIRGGPFMRRRFLAPFVIGLSIILAAGPATAETARERAAKHRAAVQAKIACARNPRCAPGASSVRPGSPGGSGKLIEISLARQTLTAWQGNTAVMRTTVSTGARGQTPTGRFRIQSKERRHWSNQFHVWMPYAMRVVGGIFIHELPITSDGRRLGAGSLGRPVSHGCIRVGIGPAARLFNWTPMGTPVIIR